MGLPWSPTEGILAWTLPSGGHRIAGGQGIVEYGLILGGIAVVAVVILVFFGDVVAEVLDIIGNAIDSATT